MLQWSVLSEEDSQYATLANDIEMTLFAVSKSLDRCRLISWPRVQNEAMPEPPYTSLPNPTLFEAIRMQGTSPGAFFLNIENVFHNITLPACLARLLPMKPIRLSHLPAETERQVAKRTSMPADEADPLLRPCQDTMPMGFKWAVFIAHIFVSSCFDEYFQLLKSSRFALAGMSLSKLRTEDAPFIVSDRSPLLLHIIDDAVVITVDWPPALPTTWHKLMRRILRINHLPVAEKKSSRVREVVQDSVSFIGCIWNLKQGIILPAQDKLVRVTECVKRLLESQACTAKDWERITGKLLWFASLNRPLLSTTQHIFYAGKPTHPALVNITSATAKREIIRITALLPLARVDTKIPVSHIVVAFDASKIAGAVTYACVPSHLAEKLWRAAQTACFSNTGNISEQLTEVAQVIRASGWKLAFIQYWKKEEHINCLEAATAVLYAEWLYRSRMSSTRTTLLTDSLVTLGALQKGRSSQTGILLRCRRYAALALAHNLRLTLAFVRSAWSPADKYTRLPRSLPLRLRTCAEHVTL